MKVAELILALQALPQDAVVVQAIDPEGNGFMRTSGAHIGRYDAGDSRFGLDELTDEDEEQGYSEEDVVDGPLAVCLWPTH
ncbi:hypothetical protein [Bradyrhizobium sp. Tv2a-2]|uniref:hypothetical protein n=1 Tax=Bradyrhizobium sp. Tv2a-2 TaxID=113395 RepID=UPI0003FBA084|nr:hypothetical protein [Bradyrhizobium sp. Tv2a-2]